MKDYHGKNKEVIFLKEITGAEFERKYMEISGSADKLPVASTIIPSVDCNGCTLRDPKTNDIIMSAFIFYETLKEDNRCLDGRGKLIL